MRRALKETLMSFRIRGLDPEPFAPLFALEDEALAARGIVRVAADAPHSAPCRISLEDAEPGERLLLLSYAHQPAATPFRQSGPIFVREGARKAYDEIDRVPDAFARRTLSARGYDRDGMMIDGELVEGQELAGLLSRWLARPEVDVVHLHYARRGCYAGLAERA
jgi:hypothetical protein